MFIGKGVKLVAIEIIYPIFILILAAWMSFSKSSLHGAMALLIILFCTGLFSLSLICVFLLILSLLMPRLKAKDQKRRFQLSKGIYLIGFCVATWFLRHHILAKPNPLAYPLTLNFDFHFVLVLSFFIFVILVLFMRQHVR